MGKKYKPRLDLDKIAKTLTEVQVIFPWINDHLMVRRENLTDDMVQNMINGYWYVDELLEAKVKPFPTRACSTCWS